MKMFLTVVVSILGVVSSFLALIGFFTGIDNVQDLKNVISGSVNTTLVSTDKPGEDPEYSMLNVAASNATDGSDSALMCKVRVDGKNVAQTPIESLPIQPGKHSISILRKGYIGENLKVDVKPGTSLALAVQMFPNTTEGVKLRNNHLAKIAKASNIEALQGVVRLVNTSLFVGWLVIAIALIIMSEFDFDALRFVGVLTLVPILAIAFAPMLVEPLMNLLKNSILTVAIASVMPIVAGVVGLFQTDG